MVLVAAYIWAVPLCKNVDPRDVHRSFFAQSFIVKYYIVRAILNIRYNGREQLTDPCFFTLDKDRWPYWYLQKKAAWKMK